MSFARCKPTPSATTFVDVALLVETACGDVGNVRETAFESNSLVAVPDRADVRR